MKGPKDGAQVSLSEIAPEAVHAARVFSVTLIVSAAALIALSWDDVWRSCAVATSCEMRSAGAVLLAVLSLAAIAWGVGILIRARRRIVHPAGSTRYVWTLGVLFALGCIFIAGRIPAFTCDRGRFDDALALCMHPPSSSDPTSWLIFKKAIVVIGLLGGVVVSVRPRNVKLTIPLAIAVWGLGFGWLVVDTLA